MSRAPRHELQPLGYFVWVSRTDKRGLVVDTGFERPVGTKRGRTVIRPVGEAGLFPTSYNLGEVLEGYETLKKLASSRHHIVPGHDPAVMKLYPASSPALAGLVGRLDVDPKV